MPRRNMPHREKKTRFSNVLASWCDTWRPLSETSDCLSRSAHRLSVVLETTEEQLESPWEGRRTVVDFGRAEIRRHDEA